MAVFGLLPVVGSCAGCGGRCCSRVRTPPYIFMGADFPPAHLAAEVAKSPFDGRPEDSPCLWLTADGRCREYAHRPRVCRDYVPGGEDCLGWW